MRPSCMCANCATTSGITTSCARLALDPDCRCTELVRESYHPFFLRARNSLLQEKRGASRARSCAVGLPAGYSLISCGAVELSYLPETAPRRDELKLKSCNSKFISFRYAQLQEKRWRQQQKHLREKLHRPSLRLRKSEECRKMIDMRQMG